MITRSPINQAGGAVMPRRFAADSLAASAGSAVPSEMAARTLATSTPVWVGIGIDQVTIADIFTQRRVRGEHALMSPLLCEMRASRLSGPAPK